MHDYGDGGGGGGGGGNQIPPMSAPFVRGSVQPADRVSHPRTGRIGESVNGA